MRPVRSVSCRPQIMIERSSSEAQSATGLTYVVHSSEAVLDIANDRYRVPISRSTLLPLFTEERGQPVERPAQVVASLAVARLP